MIAWLLALQLFALPVTNAYAAQIRGSVVVSVTYADTLPTRACTFVYALDDASWASPVDSHCWKPTSVIGDLDTWQGMRIDDANFEVVVKYPDGHSDLIYLTVKINT